MIGEKLEYLLMPTYEYKCDKCGHGFEEMQSIKADPLTSCPVCQGTIQRIINGGAGLIFRGTGFYITDYKNKKTAGSNGKDKSPQSDVKKSESSGKKSESAKTKNNSSDKDK